MLSVRPIVLARPVPSENGGRMGRMSALADELRSRSDADLLRLMSARPDLGSPAPSSVVAMASRAATRPSVERALAGLNRFELQVAEAIVALADSGASARAVPLEDVDRALGVSASTAVERLLDLALLTQRHQRVLPIQALTRAFGPYPAGLGPRLAVLDALHPSEPAPSAPLERDALSALATEAPEGALRILDALTWGPPIGTVPDGDPGPGPRWLLERCVLYRLSATELALPREVALAMRGGRLFREVNVEPVRAEAARPSAHVVGAESARAAEDLVRSVEGLLRFWDGGPPTLLRSGGLGVRELRKVAAALEVSPTMAAFVVELAASAGLVGRWSIDGEPTWIPTLDGDQWLGADLPARWAWLACAWIDSTRAAWLVGTKSAKGDLRAALGPWLDVPWAPALRRRVLRELAAWPPGAAPSVAVAHDAMAWAAPRATPPIETTSALIDEAAWLGLTGAGALAGAGRALLGACELDAPPPTARPSGHASADEVSSPTPTSSVALAMLQAALEADLPPVVDEMLVQGDLTALVPGRPSPALRRLLDAAAEVESRGGALTVRFTPRSVRDALENGLAAEALLADLRSHSRTPLPQPLEYLVTDVARRNASLRIGMASCYLRSENPGTLAALAADARLAPLGLRAIAPTVLISEQPAAAVLGRLRSADVGAMIEGPGGEIVVVKPERPRAPRSRSPDTSASGQHPHRLPTATDLARIVHAMRAGDERAAAGLQPTPASAPAHALAVLRDATESREPVVLVVAGRNGDVERRLVRPLSTDSGRVRVADVAREVEMTIAVHRIVNAVPTGETHDGR